MPHLCGGAREKFVHSIVNPVQLARNIIYWNLEKYADVMVTIDDSELRALTVKGAGRHKLRDVTDEQIAQARLSMRAVVTRRPNPRRPWKVTHTFVSMYHNVGIIIFVVLYMIFGWPQDQNCSQKVELWTRALINGLFLTVHALLV